MIKEQYKVYLYSLIAITLWGLSYIWSDELLAQGIRVEYFIFVRTMSAGIILAVFNLSIGKNLAVRRRDVPKFALLAFFEPFVYFICETYGIGLTESPTYSALIIAATPIVATAAGILFFREKLRPVNFIGIAVCLTGLVLVTVSVDKVGDKFFLGAILLCIAVFAEVGHATVTKRLSFQYDPLIIVMYQFIIGAAYLFPLFLTRGLGDFSPALYLSWGVWRPILCLAILCSSISFSLWVTSIKVLGVAKSSIFQAMIPVVTAVAGIVLGSEKMTAMQWFGIAVAITGLLLTQHVGRGKN